VAAVHRLKDSRPVVDPARRARRLSRWRAGKSGSAWSSIPIGAAIDQQQTTVAIRPATFIERDHALARLARPAVRFLDVEAAGGIVLVVAAAIALVWANSPWHGGYEALWSTPIEFRVGSYQHEEDLRHWVNDGLMALFFFVVGLEIKRELTTGELRDRRQVALPVVAAVGGMAVPALIYAAFNAGGPGASGWGIPMATDIAFALGVLAVLGSRVPPPLKVFLLTLAIVDDLGAIAVIAVFYADDVEPVYLLAAVGVMLLVVAMRRLHVTYPPLYVLAGGALWLTVYESGVHATIAGVIMGLLAPARPWQSEVEAEAVVEVLENRDQLTAEDVRATATAIKQSVSTADRLIDLLHPWTSYLVIPVFALANAGLRLNQNPLSASAEVFLGVLFGLVIGKVLGITGFAWLAVRAGLARLPAGVGWRQFTGVAALAGIGFTVSIFITGLAFTDETLSDASKVGILVASTIAAAIGALVLLAAPRARASSAAASATRHMSCGMNSGGADQSCDEIDTAP
jgi:NhaA family Na+:H+ antiporter